MASQEEINLDLTEYNQGTHKIALDYYNRELVPVSKSLKNWTWLNYTTVWAGMVHNVVQFEIAALLTFEFGPILALLITGLTYGTELVPMILNGHIGAKYGIPFPVSVRAMFGIKGATLPVLLRGSVALFWFAVQTYVGGTIINAVISLALPSWDLLTNPVIGMPANLAISFFIFWTINVLVTFRGMGEVKFFELIVGPLILGIFAFLAVFGIQLAHGIGPLFSVRGYEIATPQNITLAIASLAGAYATLVLNIMDFTRFAKTQKDQIIGQSIGFPLIFLVFSLLAIIITSTMIHAFHISLSEAVNYVNPVNIMYLFTSNIVLAIGLGITLIFATVGTNVAANLISPIYDIISLFPKKIKSWKLSALVSSLVGILYIPWIWYNNANTIFEMINLLGSFLGAVAGVMMVYYWIIRKEKLSIADLFKRYGEYWYNNGINWIASLSTIIGLIPPLLGLLIPQLSIMFSLGFYLSLALGGTSFAVIT
ncbi:cytosine permease, partial [Acidianus sp. RZ1]|uniref:cytosine permease n=1 Tax=Acidianus sp. RZ1 TaxID=1540082 RepID=UPI00149110E0